MNSPYQEFQNRYCKECEDTECIMHSQTIYKPNQKEEAINKCANTREAMSAFNLSEMKLDKIINGGH